MPETPRVRFNMSGVGKGVGNLEDKDRRTAKNLFRSLPHPIYG